MNDRELFTKLDRIEEKLNRVESDIRRDKISRHYDLRITISIAFLAIALSLLLSDGANTDTVRGPLYRSGIIFLLLIAPMSLFNLSRAVLAPGQIVALIGIIIYAAVTSASTLGIIVYSVGMSYVIIIYLILIGTSYIPRNREHSKKFRLLDSNTNQSMLVVLLTLIFWVLLRFQNNMRKSSKRRQ